MYFIAIYAAGMPFNHETLAKGESLGGSESAAYYMAMELAKLDNKVIVFTSHKKCGTLNDVTFQYHGDLTKEAPLGDQFMQYATHAPIDALVIQRHPMAYTLPFKAKMNIWWLHDLALARMAQPVTQSLLNIDKVFTVSEFHRHQVSEVYDIPLESVYPTANGLDMSLYPKEKILPLAKREPRTLLYSSRPERGLENLVGKGGIMEHKDMQDCHLYVCGYENTTPQMEGFYNMLWQRCEELPNVTNLGSLSKQDLANLQRRVCLYAYPTEFEETSCITAMESQAAGTPFIGSRHGALAETLKDAGAHLVRLKDGKVNTKKFINTVRRVLNNESEWQGLHKKALAQSFDWADVAKDWVKLIDTELAKKSDDNMRLAKHLEHNSDIVALCHHLGIEDKIGTCLEGIERDEINALHPSLFDNYRFFFMNDYEGHYKRYYEYEKARGVEYGPESLEGNQRFEAVVKLVGAQLEGMPEGEKLRILDYGCAHGHYVINLLHRFPKKLDIVGVDIDHHNIEIATNWYMEAVREGCDEDVRFVQGHSGVLDELDIGTFDLVMAGEVLEHVPDVAPVVDALRGVLRDNGTLNISTPFGAWEAVGYEKHKGWRAHLHHFERTDLFELFGHFDNYQLMLVPYMPNLGHFIVSCKPQKGVPVGKIDYARKLKTQDPRETLSVTMIVKDGEHKVGRTLEKVAGYADEIIVGVDASTTDKTKEVLAQFGATIIDIKSPIEIGFDEARNEVIKHASCDWVLWIDDDETLESMGHLEKYLRTNCFTAYSIPQHHFAQQPAGLFQTDYPTRIFRNRKGIKFYGHVHEHPELELNKGIGKVAVLHEMGIMHTGYATEAIRRKRFDRNFPLIQIDRKKYPDRILGKFLWMRDLSHVIMYESEMAQQRGIPLNMPRLQALANEIVELWRWLLKHNHMRMVRDGLAFYSNAVRVLTQGQGIEYKVNLGASKFNGGVQLAPQPIEGLFINQDDITGMTNALIKESTDAYDAKYY
jgi:glycosyltransferase involved in cell wall biosynthesis/2-polyprenyl-3-methyl-5-hydroxy-6-metoxy-1,4-benzoquinol methylase